MVSARRVVQKILDNAATTALNRVRLVTPSRTLRRSFVVRRGPGFRRRIITPYYWAGYYHDGRGTVRPRRARALVWFADPRDDPRIRGGYPKRASQARRLTRAQYQEGLTENARRAKQGLPPFMIVTHSSPRGGGRAKATPFFWLALGRQASPRSLLDTVRKRAPKVLSDWVLSRLKKPSAAQRRLRTKLF